MGSALSNMRHSDGWSARESYFLPHQCHIRTSKNTCGNYIVDFGSYSLWSNCGRMLSVVAPILGTTSCQGHSQHNVNWGLPQFSRFLCSVALCQGGRLTSCSILGESTPAWKHMLVLITCDEICNLDALQMVSSVDTVKPGPGNRRTQRLCAEDQRKLGGPKNWLTKFSSLDSWGTKVPRGPNN